MDWLRGGTAQRQFEEFVAGVTDDLVRTGFLMTGDLAETEDLVQETLLRVARRWRRVHAMDHPKAYARRILVNLVIDGGERRRRRRGELDAGDAVFDGGTDETSSGAVRGIDAGFEFRLALAALPRRQRAVIVLRYWEDMSESEVAEVLGCAVGTVKSTASRGVAHLRQIVTTHDPRSTGTSSTTEGRSAR